MHVRRVPNDVERVKAFRLLTREIRVVRTRLILITKSIRFIYKNNLFSK